MYRIPLFFTFFLCAVLNTAVAQFKPGDKPNVWRLEGVKLYAKPTLAAKVIRMIPYGKQIIIVEEIKALTLPTKVTMVAKGNIIHKPVPIRGFWSKITVDGKQGYVFDGYLSSLPCPRVDATGCEETETYLRRNFGTPKVVAVKRGNKKTYTYPNGNILITSYYDGCSDETITLKNITYREALLFTNVYTYMADAIGDLTIKKAGENTYLINSYSCD
ncbi:SH3 domain-containing protein [Mucilaginibacter boryungensis]|uniref:SH3 domain-containing protein n=1 Tax=Mucilaginibacter boryungensis TaxID=768480 RepID=A0ABR9XLD4_9SPHI|nr:SH3 domain-containing protein [Mucilaginibacter boryungensis]MBE9667768.1 SH3 domain-containing protein [Mucilaginibacter boryungensis]